MSTEETSVAAQPQPQHQTRRSDMVWLLRRGAERVRLHIEHQSYQDPSLSTRMAEYSYNIWRSGAHTPHAHTPIYPLVFGTARTPFRPWCRRRILPGPAGPEVWEEGPLLDIHAYPSPDRVRLQMRSRPTTCSPVWSLWAVCSRRPNSDFPAPATALYTNCSDM